MAIQPPFYDLPRREVEVDSGIGQLVIMVVAFIDPDLPEDQAFRHGDALGVDSAPPFPLLHPGDLTVTLLRNRQFLELPEFASGTKLLLKRLSAL